MKNLKFFPIFLVLCLSAAIFAPPALALDEPAVNSRAAIVMDRNTGEIFWSKSPDERVYPASTTKIMTVLLAVEAVEAGAVSMDDEVTASANIGYDLIADGSTAGIVAGEAMTLGNLLYCAMISSANEACNVIAEYVAGDIPTFIGMMNDRAASLGCGHTHFANTHGLPNANHYTTARDFCRIAMEASSHELFMQICNTPGIDIPATNVSGVRHLNNSNALICADSMYGSGYLYAPAAGIKTGFTSDAGYCLVSTAEKDGIALLAAVFGGFAQTGDNGRNSYTNFSDSIALYEWVFNNFSYQEVLSPGVNVASVDVNLGKDADYVNLRPAGAVTLLLPNDYDHSEFDLDLQVYSLSDGKIVTAPVTAGEVLGEVSVLRDGQNCGTAKLVAASSVDLSRTQYIRSHIRETVHTTAFRLVFWGAVLILALYLAWTAMYRVRRVRYRRAAQGGAHARRGAGRRSGAARSAVPGADTEAAPQPPEIEFFSDGFSASPDAAGGDAASGFPELEEPPGLPPFPEEPAQQAQDSVAQRRAERDYFVEFFKQK